MTTAAHPLESGRRLPRRQIRLGADLLVFETAAPGADQDGAAQIVGSLAHADLHHPGLAVAVGSGRERLTAEGAEKIQDLSFPDLRTPLRLHLVTAPDGRDVQQVIPVPKRLVMVTPAKPDGRNAFDDVAGVDEGDVALRIRTGRDYDIPTRRSRLDHLASSPTDLANTHPSVTHLFSSLGRPSRPPFPLPEKLWKFSQLFWKDKKIFKLKLTAFGGQLVL